MLLILWKLDIMLSIAEWVTFMVKAWIQVSESLKNYKGIIEWQ